MNTQTQQELIKGLAKGYTPEQAAEALELDLNEVTEFALSNKELIEQYKSAFATQTESEGE
ncbi:MAG: hypothetical protein LBM65_00715 [Oscillospiraceae bacterium]|nr:hypothetical protein [Oscillospiraceae bacterium]